MVTSYFFSNSVGVFFGGGVEISRVYMFLCFVCITICKLFWEHLKLTLFWVTQSNRCDLICCKKAAPFIMDNKEIRNMFQNHTTSTLFYFRLGHLDRTACHLQLFSCNFLILKIFFLLICVFDFESFPSYFQSMKSMFICIYFVAWS